MNSTLAGDFVVPPLDAYPVLMAYLGAPNGVFVECHSEIYLHESLVGCHAWLSSHLDASATITTISSEKYWGVLLVVQNKKLICFSRAEPTAVERADYLSGYDTEGECPSCCQSSCAY